MLFEDFVDTDIFKCTRCGDCCKGYGGTVVTDDEIHTLAKYINTDPKRFVADFCQMSGKKLVLAQGSNGYCIFWNGLCTIHPVKPQMCKTWPFIKNILMDIGNWYAMAVQCPGMRTDVPESVVKNFVGKELSKLSP
ncbi:MAG: YkgJ family cysteine cluster protein [Proteobacteria bacterium]|nr:YkgJ family cysteine cluster protein [Pseudomonadota bacterium]